MLFTCTISKAQLTGTKTIPGDYATISAAVTALNTQGVGAGGVVFDVAPGYTETIAASISLTATGTTANRITFRKATGSGANPLITAYANTSSSNTGATATLDGIWSFVGSDFVTIDGIDLQENSANTAAGPCMEYGYGFFKASATDGCSNNTIINCTVTLSRVNITAWTTNTGYVGSVAIAFTNRTLSAAALVTVSAPSGTNSFNTVARNIVQNCHTGISFTGFAATSTNFALGDSSNIVGGQMPSDSNIVRNFGGGASATTASAGIHANQQRNFRCNYNHVNSNDGNGVNHPSTLRGIYLVAAATSYSSVNNNRISIKGGGTTSTIYAMDLGNGATGGTADVLNNIIENCSYSTATSGTHYGISCGASSAAQYNVNNNIVRDNTQNNSTGLWYGIYYSGSSTALLNVNNNTVTAFTRGNAGTTYPIYIGSAGPDQNINNNTITDITVSGGTAAATTRGIYQVTGSGNIQCNGNVLLNFSSNTGSATSTLEGIRLNYGTNISIAQNTIRGFTGNAGTLTGIAGAGTTANAVYTIARNKIASLASTSASAVVSGIAQGGQTFNAINNIIGDLTAPSANNGAAIAGFNGTGGTTTRLFYNTISIAASSTGALFGTSCANIGSTNALELNNNIFINRSTSTGAAYTSALRRSGPSLTNWQIASNNNCFYAGTQSAPGVVYTDGTTHPATMADFKQLVAPRESASFSEVVPFVTATPSDANYLHVSTTSPTQCESGGTPLPSQTTIDYSGDTRSTTTPDVGADEFNGVGLDATGPTISYTPLTTGTICFTNRTLMAVTITDPAGIFTGANTKPRLYFKKQSENNVLATSNDASANGWKFVETSSSASPFSFTINHALLNSALVVGDTVRYFVVATDSLNNVGANTASFAATPTSVALTSAAFPVSGNVVGYGIAPLPNAVNIATSKTTICVNENIVFDTTNTYVPGAEYQWQSSSPGANSFANISGATTVPYTFANANTAMDIRLLVSCGGTAIPTSPSNVVALALSNPTPISVVPSTKCGIQTQTISGILPSGATAVWQDSIGQVLGAGLSFTTPAISSTTAYYLVGVNNGPLQAGARFRPAGTTSATASTYGLVFNATAAFRLYSVKVYPAGVAGNAVINLTTSTGTVLTTRTIAIPAGNGTVPFEMILNMDVPIGSDMRLIAVSSPAMVREQSLGGYPYALGSYGAITNGYISGTNSNYYYFYDWRMVPTGSSPCVASPTAVVATVTQPPAIGTSGNTSICAGTSTNISATSSNAGYSYTFSPGNLAGASHSVSPVVETKYVVTATDNSNGANAGCVNLDSFTVSVRPSPAATTATPTAVSVCNTAQLLSSPRPAFTGDSKVSGTGTTTNTASAYPTPLGNYNGGQRQQILYLASELTAMGIPANAAISSISFTVSNANSATAMSNYTIAMGQTNATALSATFTDIATLTTVYPSAIVTPVAGVNTISFSNNFVWDGTSNLIVDIAYNNSAALLSSGNASVVQSATTFVSVNSARENSLAGGLGTIYAATSDATYSQRPNTTFGYTSAITKTWAPTTGLFRDAAATVPYSGADTVAVYALPSTSTTYTVSSRAVNNCSTQVPVVVTVDCSLPVTLINFRGTRQGKQALLSWETSQELNNHGFFIEKSKDGNTFSTIAFVNSKHSNGISSQSTAYSTTDAALGNGTYFYRLKQTDKDGKYAYSATVKLSGTAVDALAVNILYPNPVVTNLQLHIATPKATKLHTTVYSLQGNILLQQWNVVGAGETALQMNLASLPAGNYRVKVADPASGMFVVKAFVKL
ncbi:MAG: hypothetical protein EAY72_09040 [Bacteroidetes bacterium]|nr:MAG: hypothetical protein EAY72_09040 [Bacteroidota bacterium]